MRMRVQDVIEYEWGETLEEPKPQQSAGGSSVSASGAGAAANSSAAASTADDGTAGTAFGDTDALTFGRELTAMRPYTLAGLDNWRSHFAPDYPGYPVLLEGYGFPSAAAAYEAGKFRDGSYFNFAHAWTGFRRCDIKTLRMIPVEGWGTDPEHFGSERCVSTVCVVVDGLAQTEAVAPA